MNNDDNINEVELGMNEEELEKAMIKKQTPKKNSGLSAKSILARKRKGLIAAIWLKVAVPYFNQHPQKVFFKRSSLIELAKKDLSPDDRQLYVVAPKEQGELEKDILPLVVTSMLHDLRDKTKGVSQTKVKGFWELKDIDKLGIYLQDRVEKMDEAIKQEEG